MYPNGISCTLPEDLQQDMVNTIAGLENAKMIHPGKCLVCHKTCRQNTIESERTIQLLESWSSFQSEN